MKRFELALLIGLLLSIGFGSFSSFAREWDGLRDEVVRLHILANSDSDEDQALKLAVRDAILDDTADLFQGALTKEDAETAAEGHLEGIRQVALEEVRRQGYPYDVSVRLVNRFFDTRVYEDFTLPAGRYDAVQVEIGSGGGRNWWCVMFPPMCVPAASEHSELPLEEQIREMGGPPRYKPAFAVVEAIESLQEKWGSQEETAEIATGAME